LARIGGSVRASSWRGVQVGAAPREWLEYEVEERWRDGIEAVGSEAVMS
jgi:hypothetical protein